MSKLHVKKMADRFNSLVIRERLLLVGAALAAIYICFDFLAIGPTQKKMAESAASIVAQTKQLDSLKAEELILTKVLSNDPNTRLKRELDELTSQLNQMDRDIQQVSAGLVSGEQLAVMLQDVLKLTDKLQVESLHTLPPEKLNLNPNSPAPVDKSAKATPSAIAIPLITIPELNLYRQGVKLVIQGNYFQVLDYLKQLEQTPWRFYWDELHYRVLEYPIAQVELQVYTLSLHAGSHND